MVQNCFSFLSSVLRPVFWHNKYVLSAFLILKTEDQISFVKRYPSSYLKQRTFFLSKCPTLITLKIKSIIKESGLECEEKFSICIYLDIWSIDTFHGFSFKENKSSMLNKAYPSM